MTKVNELLNLVNDKSEYFYIHKERYYFILNQIFKLNLPPGSKILDVGCYPLHLYKALEGAGYEVFGISSKHEKVSTKKIYSMNIEKEDLPFRQGEFDLILFSEVMEHLLYSPLVYMDKFKKVLKDGGYILITTPNAAQIKKRLMGLFGKTQGFELFQLYESEVSNDYIYHRHNREYSLKEVEDVVNKAGFKVKLAKEFNAYSPLRDKLHPEPFQVRLSKGIVFLPAVFFPTLRDSLFVLGQK